MKEIAKNKVKKWKEKHWKNIEKLCRIRLIIF